MPVRLEPVISRERRTRRSCGISSAWRPGSTAWCSVSLRSSARSSRPGRWPSEAGTTGPLTAGMFQAALRAAKRVTTETGVGRERTSIPSVAVADFAAAVFERFDDKRVLLRRGRQDGRRDPPLPARGRGPRRDGAQPHRQPGGGTGRPARGPAGAFAELAAELAAADLVVSTTGADEPVVSLAAFRQVAARRRRPAAGGARPGRAARLRSADRRVCPASGSTRSTIWPPPATPTARAASGRCRRPWRSSEEETVRFMADMHHRTTAPVIEQLKAGWSETGEAELERLFRRLPDLDEAERAEIRQAFERYAAKLLHPPLASLRSESRAGPAARPGRRPQAAVSARRVSLRTPAEFPPEEHGWACINIQARLREQPGPRSGWRRLASHVPAGLRRVGLHRRSRRERVMEARLRKQPGPGPAHALRLVGGSRFHCGSTQIAATMSPPASERKIPFQGVVSLPVSCLTKPGSVPPRSPRASRRR